MKTLLVALILIVVIAMAIAQFAFMFWLARKANQNRQPLSPEQYNFFCKIIAGVLFLVATAAASYTAFLLTTGTKTTGTVIEMREKRDENNQSMFAPTFIFIDSNGKTNTVSSPTYSSPASYRVGQRVPIVYRNLEPASARINAFAENWLITSLSAGFGCLALVSMPIYRKWRKLRGASLQPSFGAV